jgi:hypothetical protein
MKNHNAADWLRVEYIGKNNPGRPGRGYQWEPGWYVLRTCPCHKGLAVTLPFATEAAAERARRVMIEVSEKLGTA